MKGGLHNATGAIAIGSVIGTVIATTVAGGVMSPRAIELVTTGLVG